MKLGILTQPLKENYGGLLQAYALKTVLGRLGHEVYILNRQKDTISFNYRVKSFVRSVIKKDKNRINPDVKRAISVNMVDFVQKHIKHVTPPIYSTGQLKRISADFEGFVVGSDQCWRPKYSPKISDYFLDFMGNGEKLAISYAASFGVDNWEYSKKDTLVCKNNIHKFKAISVRELSGQNLTQKYFNKESYHVLDPTMLLNKEDYVNLIKSENEEILSENYLLKYVLDNTQEKENLIEIMRKGLSLNVLSAHPPKINNFYNDKKLEEYIYPKVTTWLNSFNSAKFVITDSFHGTVFSILFNKPFLVIPNLNRGSARFESLLGMFQLEDRLISNIQDFSFNSINNLPEIDWDTVNNILKNKREFSMNFLQNNLK